MRKFKPANVEVLQGFVSESSLQKDILALVLNGKMVMKQMLKW